MLHYEPCLFIRPSHRGFQIDNKRNRRATIGVNIATAGVLIFQLGKLGLRYVTVVEL